MHCLNKSGGLSSFEQVILICLASHLISKIEPMIRTNLHEFQYIKHPIKLYYYLYFTDMHPRDEH
jgi:hypothetical protein